MCRRAPQGRPKKGFTQGTQACFCRPVQNLKGATRPSETDCASIGRGSSRCSGPNASTHPGREPDLEPGSARITRLDQQQCHCGFKKRLNKSTFEKARLSSCRNRRKMY